MCAPNTDENERNHCLARTSVGDDFLNQSLLECRFAKCECKKCTRTSPWCCLLVKLRPKLRESTAEITAEVDRWEALLNVIPRSLSLFSVSPPHPCTVFACTTCCTIVELLSARHAPPPFFWLMPTAPMTCRKRLGVSALKSHACSCIVP